MDQKIYKRMQQGLQLLWLVIKQGLIKELVIVGVYAVELYAMLMALENQINCKELVICIDSMSALTSI